MAKFNPNAITTERLRHGVTSSDLQKANQSDSLRRAAVSNRLPKQPASTYTAKSKIYNP